MEFNLSAIGWIPKTWPSQDQFTAFVLDFGSVSLDGPEVIDFSTVPYSNVPGCPDFSQINSYLHQYVNPFPQAVGYVDYLLVQANAYLF